MGKLEDALEFLDIQEWVERYVETNSVGTDEIRIKDCPKCFNDKWKVYINVEKRIWFCQRCSWGRHVPDICVLLAAIAGMNIHTVRMEVAATVVPSLSDDEFLATLNSQVSPSEVLEEFDMDPIDLPGEVGLSGMMGKKAEQYLIGRGLTLADIERYQLRLASKLRNNSGPWAVFPILYYGVPVACQGRRFTNNNEPRYLSSDKIAQWMWPLDEGNLTNIESGGSVVLVEGVFDALAYVRAGTPALCTFGKNLSRSQLKLLQSHGVKKLYLSYDADAHKDICSTAERVGHLFQTYIVELPPLADNPKADPGDVLAGIVDSSWLTTALANAIDIRTNEFWIWKLKRELEA